MEYLFCLALCKDDANGNVPLGKSCNRYWACQGGYPRLQRCPAMLVFDKNRKRCVTPPTEDCEVPTTNAPNSDEEQTGTGGGGGAADLTGESGPRPVNPNPNPRRGSGAPAGGRRSGGGGGASRPQGPPQAIPLEGPGGEPLPFNLPPGAVPLNN
jgi:Chitin binding Peritrophin-A domain